MVEPVLDNSPPILRQGAESHDHDRRTLADQELLRRFVQEHDQASFEALVHRHGPWVLGVCRRILGNTHDAEDAFQATFLVLAKKAATLQWGALLSNWLHGVAQRTAQKARVTAARRCRHEQNHAEKYEQQQHESEHTQRLRAIIDEELELLPAKFRHPLSKHYLEGKSREETAKELGWTVGAVKGSLERGRELLRSRLAKRGLACNTTLLDTLFVELELAEVVQEIIADTSRTVLTGNISPHVDQLAKNILESQRWPIAKPLLAALLICCGLIGVGIIGWGVYSANQAEPGPEPAQQLAPAIPAAPGPQPPTEAPVPLPLPNSSESPSSAPLLTPNGEPSPIRPLALILTEDGWFVMRTNTRTGATTIAPIDDWDDDDE